MAEDDIDRISAPTASGSEIPVGPVLDQHGKPCRACNTKSQFSAWTSMAKHATPSVSPATPATPAATTPPSPASSANSLQAECPADVEQLGRSTWTFLHTVAATYPESPSAAQQTDLSSFMRLFARLYPCWVCAEDFQTYMARTAPTVSSRAAFGDWLCRAHNDVNQKLGKPTFDCSKWEERWRTGPKDGRCD